MEGMREERLMLVVRNPGFGLPTACPDCLPVFLYLKFAKHPFDLSFQNTFPDSEQIPYAESDDFVAYNNEKGGVIECLKDAIVNLDSSVQTIPEWVSAKAMVESWLGDAVMYELWLGADGKVAQKMYYSDLPWAIGKVLYFKEVFNVKRLLGITKENVERRETEIYRNADMAYKALSSLLGEESYLYGDRPTSLDAAFLGHALLVAQALPMTSTLRDNLLSHKNLVEYTKKHSTELINVDSLSSSVPLHSSDPSSSKTKQTGFSNWSSSKPKKPRKERTEEEKKFRRRAKYFLGAQFVAILVFLSLLGGSDDVGVDVGDDDDEGYDYSD